MSDCGISDLGMEGYPFTWERGRGTEQWVQEKLDRAFVNEDWRNKFPSNRVQNLIAPASDHSSIFFQVKVWRPIPNGYRFHFVNSWLREERCGQIVVDCWEKNKLKTVAEKIKSCAQELRNWGKRMAKSFKYRLERYREKMNRLRGCSDAFSAQCYREMTTEYSKLLSHQEDFWKQRAKQHWLKVVDCNSKYFHTYASSRKKNNHITQLRDDEGNWKNWSNGLAELIGSYYDSLFKSQGSDMGNIFECIESRINSEQNEQLIQEFTAEGVKTTIFSMHSDKSPGPDGMNPAFYQLFWSVIGNDVTQECLNILALGSFRRDLNDTLVVLISKKNSPESITDLRPI